MNSTNVIAFAIGTAVGSAASYFIFKKKFQADADLQIKEVRNKLNELKEANEFLHTARAKSDQNINKPYEPIIKTGESDRVDYNAISSKKKQKEVDPDEEIHQISEHEYYECVENKKYSEKIFTFYQGDNQLIDDETESAVYDPEMFLGPHGVDVMSGLTVEEAYFVDNRVKMVYTVTVSEDSYDLNES